MKKWFSSEKATAARRGGRGTPKNLVVEIIVAFFNGLLWILWIARREPRDAAARKAGKRRRRPERWPIPG